MRAIRVLTTLFFLAGAGAALAQDVTDDWEIVRQPEDKTVFAFVPTTTGLTIAFRCVDGAYGAVMAGLPAAPRQARIRTLRIGPSADHLHDSVWSVTTDRTVAMADYPASLARSLRDGGPVSIVVPGGGGEGRNLRHDLTLPSSSAAIDETLAACGRPLEDPRDALLPEIEENGLPRGVVWTRQPRPTYPATNYAEGFAVLTCVVQPDGGVDQCQVESEFPLDGGFGRAALRSTRNARLTSPGETVGQYAPRMIGFRVNYRMR
jgi:hypothetical protein